MATRARRWSRSRVDDEFAPLPRGTVATVRQNSLSSVAGRQVQLTLPPASEQTEEIEDGGTLTQQETVSAVDLDEVFNTLDTKTVKDFKRVIKGFRDSYEGVSKQANEGFRYSNPFLSTSRRVFGELTRDTRAFESLIVDTAKLSGLLAERRSDVSGLVGNANAALGAIGNQRAALARAINLLPGLHAPGEHDLRQPAGDAHRPESPGRRLDPGRRPARAVLRRVPGRGRRRGADDPRPLGDRPPPGQGERPGRADPLAGAAGPRRRRLGRARLRLRPARETSSRPPTTTSPTAPSARRPAPCRTSYRRSRTSAPTSRSLVGWFDGFSTSGTLDASGGIGRISTTFNAFSPGLVSGIDITDPLDLAGLLEGTVPGLDLDARARCPGALERDPGDGSTPFTDGGALNCDPSTGAARGLT